jgi:hypothetical protein
MVQTETCASTPLKEGLGLRLRNKGQEALYIVLWTAVNKCLGGIRTPYFAIVDDFCTTYKMSDWSLDFLPLSSVYQRTRLGREGK